MRLPSFHSRSLIAAIVLTGGLWFAALPHARGQGGVDAVFGGASLSLFKKIGAMTVQPDGKLVAVGTFHKGIVRINPDGTQDETFNPGRGIFLDSSTTANTLALQSDGKILVGGSFYQVDGVARYGIARFNADGSLDTTFDAGQTAAGRELTYGTRGQITGVAQLASGDILLSRNFVNDTASILRVHADGSADASFPTLEFTTSRVSFTLQPDGRIILSGSFTAVSGVPRSGLARLNADGSLDALYNPGSTINSSNASTPLSAFATSTGQTVIFGPFTAVGGVARNGIARLNADGSLDPTFDAGAGVDFPQNLYSISVQADDKILLGGGFNHVDGVNRTFLARLNANGSVDLGFDPGIGPDSAVSGAVSSPDGSVYLKGYFTLYNGVARRGLARLNADASLNPGFAADVASGPDSDVRSIALQPDGKMLVGGSFASVGGALRNGVARLNADGTLDQSFVPATVVDTEIRSMGLQADGKIVVGGVGRTSLVRLNSNGSADPSLEDRIPYESLYQGTSQLYALALQPDGKIVVGGIFDMIDGFSRRYIARLNSDGSVDEGFDPGVNDAIYVACVALQPDGKVLMAGDFSQVQGVPRKYLARLNADGSLDRGFNFTSNGHVQAVCVLPDGRIAVGGDFFLVNNVYRKYIAVLNPDGSLDAGFDPGDSLQQSTLGTPNGPGVFALAAQPDGKIVAGGSFDVRGGMTRNLMRFIPTGTPDPFFSPGDGADGQVEAFSVQPDGKIILGGDFGAVGGVLRNFVARVTTGGVPDFFYGQVEVGQGFFYQQFTGGNPFGYYNFAGTGYSFPYVYHSDLGMEYFYDARDGRGGAYLYDFKSNGFFYTSPNFPFPYLYDFKLNTVLYYYPDPTNAGHYNTNGVRYFFRFDTGAIISK